MRHVALHKATKPGRICPTQMFGRRPIAGRGGSYRLTGTQARSSRYISRPAIAEQRLSLTQKCNVRFQRIKFPWVPYLPPAAVGRLRSSASVRLERDLPSSSPHLGMSAACRGLPVRNSESCRSRNLPGLRPVTRPLQSLPGRVFTGSFGRNLDGRRT